MFIKELKIIFSETNRAVREVKFHSGVNLIVDTESSELHNKVGKTTFLRLIDVALGGKAKKNIYYDVETNNYELELQSKIEEDKLAVVLILSDDLFKETEKVECRVDLFNRGKRYINGDPLPYGDYCTRLNQLLFGNEINIPTFRQAISTFMRISLKGDDTSFLKTLPNASTAVYRSLYNYLFDISDPVDDKKLGDLKHELNKIKESEKRYKSLQNAKGIAEHKQVLNALIRERDVVQAKLDDIVDERFFKENREKINSVRERYSELGVELANLDFKIERMDKTISEMRNEAAHGVNEELSKAFFDEVKELIPSVDKTFNEMILFNKALSENQLEYFSGLKKDLAIRQKELKEEQKSIIENDGNYVSLVENNKIDEYEKMQSKLLDIQKRIDSVETTIETLEKYAGQQDEIKNEISLLEDPSVEEAHLVFDERMDQFNRFFTSIAKEINNEEPVLVYYPDTKDFPVGIDSLYGTSTGTRKSLIAAYDISYQRFAQEIGKLTPRFVVHDVVESIEGESLNEVIKQEQASGSQYILAVLKEKLDSSGLSEEEQNAFQIIQLSTDNRLFDYDRNEIRKEDELDNNNAANVEIGVSAQKRKVCDLKPKDSEAELLSLSA